jgi:hypothetical protein
MPKIAVFDGKRTNPREMRGFGAEERYFGEPARRHSLLVTLPLPAILAPMRYLLLVASLILAAAATAAERKFDFGQFPENQTPPGFRSVVSGEGKPGDWKVIMEDVPSALKPLTPQAPSITKRGVLAQLAQDPTDEHFAILIFDDETYGDFTLTTRFKTVSGTAEQMAGIAFRIQNETNYYVVRASSLGNTFRWYKVVNGARGLVAGPEVKIPNGVWHEMTVSCEGNKINCFLNGQQFIPTITDTSFNHGKIGFWTKSDSVSYFQDTKIVYKQREVPAQKLVRETVKNYGRLLGLKLYIQPSGSQATRIIASKDESEIGQPGTDAELKAIQKSDILYAKSKESVDVIMPLRDRNGDSIAAARVVMKTFPGQTEKNALARATPIVKEMQTKIRGMEDLVE